MSEEKKIAMAEFRAERDQICLKLGLTEGIKFAEESTFMKALVNEFLASASLKSSAKDLPFTFDPATRHMWYLLFVSLVNIFTKIDAESLTEPDDLDEDALNTLVCETIEKNTYLGIFWKWTFTVREKGEKSYNGLATLSTCEKNICGDGVQLILAMTIFKDICEIIIGELAKISKHEFSEKKFMVKVKRFATILNNISTAEVNPDSIDNLIELCAVCAKVKPEKVKVEKPVKPAKKVVAKKAD